jgi:hypothetical protein
MTMTVQLDKGPRWDQQTSTPGAVPGPVSLHKTNAPITQLPDGADPDGRRPDPAPYPVPSGQPSTREPTSAGRRFGRVALAAAFVFGVVLAGGIGAAGVERRTAELGRARSELASTHQHVATLHARLRQTTGRLDSTTSQLESTRNDLTRAESEAESVAERAQELSAQEKQLAHRSAGLDKREKVLAARESAVEAREAALVSPDVGHPLLDSISDDGTWVVGRDIKPGTWTSDAYDTGCTWSTSDGRRGSGDGSYNEMNVHLMSGQSFTVHGCTMWSNFSF